MEFIAWIILGGLAGWFASMVMGTDAEQGMLGNIIVGIIGAFIGGFLMRLFGAEGTTGISLWSLVVATLGAIVLLWAVKAMRRST